MRQKLVDTSNFAIPAILAILVAAGCGKERTTAPGRPAAPVEELSLGINLAAVSDASTEMVFTDLFKQSRPWISQQQGKGWGEGPPLDVDPDGWIHSLRPRQYATAIMCSSGGHPPGDYLCLYEGEGELEFGGNTKASESSPGRISLEVSAEPQMHLHLKRVSPGNPVRKIRIIRADDEDTYEANLFRSEFLERTSQFEVVRFMDWMHTNNSQLRSWRERSHPSSATQVSRHGVSLEYMIRLANEIDVDAWFCMPHLADDTFVRNFAEQVYRDLEPGRKVYVEHSNEVWNGQFRQAKFASERGLALGLSNKPGQAQLFYHAKRSVDVFKIWRSVFTEPDRLVCVVGSQSANPQVTAQLVGFPGVEDYGDAIAIAPYFGGGLGSPKRRGQDLWELDDVFAFCRDDVQLNEKRITEAVRLAGDRGLELIAYEGGQHLAGVQGTENNAPLMALFNAANRDPRMKELYLESLDSWKESGGRLFVHYNSVSGFGKWGSWGLLESEAQDPADSPKYEAILSILERSQQPSPAPEG